MRAAVPGTPGLVTAIVRALDQAGITVDDAEVRQPSLDDVFFALAGQPSGRAGGRGSPPSGPDLPASGRKAAAR